MKRFILIVLIFGLFGIVGCVGKNEINHSEVYEPTQIPTKVLNEDKPVVTIQPQNPTKALTQDKPIATINPQNNVDTKHETQKTTNNGIINIKDISSFIPQGWHILQKHNGELAVAEGDLNNDGLFDKVVVIEENIKANSQRDLLILFGNSDNTYTLSIKTEKAILLAREGGGFGDPFEDVVIDRGSIMLKFFGGSSRWHKYYRFRYQNNGWYLIGYTKGAYVSNGAEMVVLEDDYNLLTGDFIIQKIEDGKIKTTKGNRGKIQLINLKDFVADEDDSMQF